MSEELKSQEATPTSNEQSAQTTQSDENVDYKSLYLEEVGNAKKLRKRAQESELTISEYKKNQETFKELSENLQGQLDQVSPFKEKWENYESSRRDNLLSKLPKEDRESLAQESLKTLEYITGKLSEKETATSPAPIAGATRNISETPKENIFGMSPEDRKRHWESYMNKLNNNKKK